LLYIVGATPLVLPAPKGVVASMAGSTCAYNHSIPSFMFTPGATNPTGSTTVIEATRCMSKGRQPGESDFKYIAINQFTSLTNLNIASSYAAVFGQILTTGAVWIKATVVNQLSGQISVATVIPVVFS